MLFSASLHLSFSVHLLSSSACNRLTAFALNKSSILVLFIAHHSKWLHTLPLYQTCTVWTVVHPHWTWKWNFEPHSSPMYMSESSPTWREQSYSVGFGQSSSTACLVCVSNQVCEFTSITHWYHHVTHIQDHSKLNFKLRIQLLPSLSHIKQYVTCF